MNRQTYKDVKKMSKELVKFISFSARLKWKLIGLHGLNDVLIKSYYYGNKLCFFLLAKEDCLSDWVMRWIANEGEGENKRELFDFERLVKVI